MKYAESGMNKQNIPPVVTLNSYCSHSVIIVGIPGSLKFLIILQETVNSNRLFP